MAEITYDPPRHLSLYPVRRSERRKKAQDELAGKNKRRKTDEIIVGTNRNHFNHSASIPLKSLTDPFHSKLPIEIRWHILKGFTSNELLALRLIANVWKSTVDSFAKVNVTIFGNNEEHIGRCTLQMNCCKLVSLQKTELKSIFQAPCPVEVHVLHGISQINFKELLYEWSHLSKLKLCWRTIMKNVLLDKKAPRPKAKVPFPSLKSFEIEIFSNDNLGKTSSMRISANVGKLTAFEYPALTTLKIVYVGYRELHVQERYFFALLPFVRSHAKSLESVEFSLKYASLTSYPPVHPRHILFCVPTNFNKGYKSPYLASEEHLITTRLHRPPKDHPTKCQEWIDMLHDDRNFELAIGTRFLNWTIRHLEFFTPTINAYSKFLTRIDLMNVTMYDSGNHSTATQLDFEVFTCCIHLQQLQVYRAPIIFHEDEIDPPTEIINLHTLPKTLQELVVDGLPASSQDILLTIKNLEGLSAFRYFQSQVPRRNALNSNGINWEVLNAITQHKNLKDVRVHANPSITHESCYEMYDESIKNNASNYGWNTNGIIIGYMHMFEVILTKGNISI